MTNETWMREVGRPIIDRAARQDEIVGANVRSAREREGLTQRDLADVLAKYGWELDPTAITKIEKGSRSLRIGQLYLLARVLHSRPEDLIRDQQESVNRDYRHVQRGLQATRQQIARNIREINSLRQALARIEHDGLLSSLEPPLSNFESADQLLPWLSDQIASIQAEDRLVIVAGDDGQGDEEYCERLARDYQALVNQLAADLVRGPSGRPQEGVDHGEHPEA